MSEFIAVPGRNLALSIAELAALGSVKPFTKQALRVELTQKRGARLGGIVKLVEPLGGAATPEEAIEKTAHKVRKGDGKHRFGISVYGPSRAIPDRLSRQLKRLLKERDIPASFVPSTRVLSTAQVKHNDLLKDGAEWCLFESGTNGNSQGNGSGKKTWQFGRTAWIPDFEGFAARDFEKPAADAKRGMLPPQLARSMVNLATRGDEQLAVYDPFCGVGNLLMESALLGHRTFGSDITADAVEAAKENLAWLRDRHSGLPKVEVVVQDATMALPTGEPAALATEGYLGTPIRESATGEDIEQEARFVETLVEKFLRRGAEFLQKDYRLVLTIPAWQLPDGSVRRLTAVDQAERLGYAVIRPVPEGFAASELTNRRSIDWARPKQRVIHELFILEKD